MKSILFVLFVAVYALQTYVMMLLFGGVHSDIPWVPAPGYFTTAMIIVLLHLIGALARGSLGKAARYLQK